MSQVNLSSAFHPIPFGQASVARIRNTYYQHNKKPSPLVAVKLMATNLKYFFIPKKALVATYKHIPAKIKKWYKYRAKHIFILSVVC